METYVKGPSTQRGRVWIPSLTPIPAVLDTPVHRTGRRDGSEAKGRPPLSDHMSAAVRPACGGDRRLRAELFRICSCDFQERGGVIRTGPGGAVPILAGVWC